MKKINVDPKFWLEFQKAVASLDPNKVADMSYFVSEADRQYLFETFEEDFDDITVVAILEAKPTDLKRIRRNNVEFENNPFNILQIPSDVNEVFTLSINYYKNDDDYDDDFDDFEDEYDNVESYEDETGEEWSSEDVEFKADFDDDFDDDEIDEIIMKRTLVFGLVNGELKYFGNFTLQ